MKRTAFERKQVTLVLVEAIAFPGGQLLRYRGRLEHRIAHENEPNQANQYTPGRESRSQPLDQSTHPRDPLAALLAVNASKA